MAKAVYLLQGPNLPTKVAVVAFDLEQDVLLSITNRFETSGNLYTTLVPVHGGVIKLGTPIFGKDDQAYFPGYLGFKLESEGGTNSKDTDSQPGRVLSDVEQVLSSRRAFLVTHTTDEAVENWVIVAEDNERITGEMVAKALAEKPGKATIECKFIGSGTFQVDPVIARMGFTVRLAPAVTPQLAW